MRIFVTGATGFIGKHLLTQLVGHEVLCLTRSSSANFGITNVRRLVGDLNSESDLTSELAVFEADVAIHLAWQGLPDYSPEVCETNVRMSRNLLRLLIRSKCKRIVVAGSCFEYGLAEGELEEDLQVKSNSDFSNAKFQIQNEFKIACHVAQIELVWSRIFYSYGPGQRQNSLLPTVYNSIENGLIPIIKTPGAIQDLIFIDDVAAALVKLSLTKSIDGVFNIGSGSSISVAEFVNLIGKACASNLQIPIPEKLSGSWASINKIKGATGWSPKFSIEEGVLKTVKDMRKFQSV